jgi:hypothetical protein
MEEIVGGDGVVDFGLEDGYEAGLAELLVILRAQDQRAVGLAQGAGRGCHSVSYTRILEVVEGVAEGHLGILGWG